MFRVVSALPVMLSTEYVGPTALVLMASVVMSRGAISLLIAGAAHRAALANAFDASLDLVFETGP